MPQMNLNCKMNDNDTIYSLIYYKYKYIMEADTKSMNSMQSLEATS